MGIKQPIVASIAHRTWCIDEFGMAAMFLLEGDERALLIDTGLGLFDLPALIRQYTDKPLLVALTHGHVDHAGGIGQLAEVYVHPDDREMALAVTRAEREDYVRHMLNLSEGIYDVAPETLRTPEAVTKLLPLTGGTTISLGNRDVAVVETPGHTPGGLSFLDRKERLLFSGDACNANTLLALGRDDPAHPRPKSGVSDLLAAAEALEALHAEYDRHFTGHIGYGAAVSVLPAPEALIRDCIGLCRDLLAGTVVGVPAGPGGFAGECLVARTRTMQIQYRPEQVK